MAIVDSGACCSVVGQESFDEAMKKLKIHRLVETVPNQGEHRFGNHEEVQNAQSAGKFPFKIEGKTPYGKEKKVLTVEFF